MRKEMAVQAVISVKNGILEIGGVSSDKVAAVCETPLFVYDEAALEKKMQDYKTHFRSELFDTEVIYASKAFTCKAMLHKLKRFISVPRSLNFGPMTRLSRG